MAVFKVEMCNPFLFHDLEVFISPKYSEKLDFGLESFNSCFLPPPKPQSKISICRPVLCYRDGVKNNVNHRVVM